MTASAPIAGTLPTIPDTASAPLPDSGAPAHADFRSVLEQFHASRESDSNADDPKSAREQKHKDSDPATATLAIPQTVTPSVEAPRLILPLTTSFTLRQDTTASPDDTAAPDTTAPADDTAAQNTTQNTAPAADPKTVSTTVILRGTIDLRTLTLDSDPKTETATTGQVQPKTHTKSHAKSQTKWTDSTPSKAVTAPLAVTTTADESAPLLPATSSTTATLDQAASAVQISSTVKEAPDTATTSTSTVDRGAFILASSRNAAYQYHSSHEVNPATAGTGRTVRQEQRDSDPTAAITVPLPVADAVEPQRLVHAPAAPTAPRQDAPALQNSSAATQDSSASSATDSKTAMPPAIMQAEDTTTTPPSGTLAFAARLTPAEDTPAPAPDASRAADSPLRVPNALPSATPVTAKQFAAEADLPADTHGGESGNQSDKENHFAKPEMALPQTHATFQDQTTAAPTSHASTSPLSPAARMDQVQEPRATAPSGNHDITIRIPDSNTDQGTAVRFVERAGEVHVSVRTGDAEMAQTLRGGLNDLVNRLEDGGIRTQVWQPGTDSSTSHNDSQQPFADPDGSNGRQDSSGSNSEQESKQQNRPRWVEELEGSIGNPNFKETTQLLWQA